MTLRDGQVIDGTAFYDSIAFNELSETVNPLTRTIGWRDRPAT